MTESRPSLEEIYNSHIKSTDLPASNRPSLEEIYAKHIPSVKAEEPSLASRIGQDISENIGFMSEAGKAEREGKIGSFQTGVRAAEGIGGILGAVPSEVVKSGYEAVPTFIKQPVEAKAKQVAEYIANTNIGKMGIAAASQGKEAFDKFAQKYPEEAKTIAKSPNLANFAIAPSLGEAIKNVAVSGAQTAGGELAAPYLKKAGEGLIQSSEEKAAAKETGKIVKMISPVETKKVALQNVPRTEERGLLGIKYVRPTDTEQEIAKTVQQVPGVNPEKSYLHNYTKINEENIKEARNLEKALQDSNIIIPKEKILQAAQEVRNSLNSESVMVGDAKKSANVMLNEAQKIIDKNGYTASGLLQSRKEFDQYAKKQMTGLFNDPETARKKAYRAVRNSLNKLVEESVPDVKVRESLSKQSRLFSALDNIDDKAASEGKNVISRKIERLEEILPEGTPKLVKHVAVPAIATGKLVGSVIPSPKLLIGKGLTKMGDILAPKE